MHVPTRSSDKGLSLPDGALWGEPFHRAPRLFEGWRLWFEPLLGLPGKPTVEFEEIVSPEVV